MRTVWSLASLVLVACFSEPPPAASSCEAGTIGCQCGSDDSCESAELTCVDAYCIPVACEAGTMYCSCNAGSCDGALVCQDGAVCVPPGGAETGSATSIGSSLTASGSSESTATTTEPATSASTVDTQTQEGFCGAFDDAVFCDDFDDGMLEAVWGPAMTSGGATVGLTSTQVVSVPFAAEIHVPPAETNSQAIIAVSLPATAPFVGTARASVRLGAGCFDNQGLPQRRVISFSFYDDGDIFANGVRVELGGAGGALYQWGGTSVAFEALPSVTVDTWIEIELAIDAATNAVVVRFDGMEVWSGSVQPMRSDIVPRLTIGPWAMMNPDMCSMWVDDVVVLPVGP